MSSQWKTLVVSMLVFQLVLTGCFLKIADYLIWLHFYDRDSDHGLTNTAPGRTILIALGIAFGLMVAINIAAAYRAEAKRP